MSCLFNSLCKIVNVDSFYLRQQICDFLEKEDDNMNVWGDLPPSKIVEFEGKTLKSYICEMRKPSTWGGALEIFVFVTIYKININVVNIRDRTGKEIEFVVKDNQTTSKISWNGGHYEFIHS